jgi:hypothetical protein
MPSDHASRNDRSTYWSGIAGILAIQLAVLFALCLAAIAYLNWSSNTALADFMATDKPAVSKPGHPQLSVPIQQVKTKSSCPRKA